MMESNRFLQSVIFALILLLNLKCAERPANRNNDNLNTSSHYDTNAIRVCPDNPYYFQYKGVPLLLLGASDYHNIFQRTDLVEHLDKMISAGGNYVRNTMASREITDDHNDLWPYKIVEHTDDPLIKIYDLNQFNEEYWRRFSFMLEETFKREVIVEIELWERHDTYRTRDQAGWERHPYNPDNNINYTSEESGLPSGEWIKQEFDKNHPFFKTVPRLQDNQLVLKYQRAFIDKLLTYTEHYDHILYNMNNETQEHRYFGEYWAGYLLKWAKKHGKHIEITDMQDNHNVKEVPVQRIMESDLYTFVDISQNNFQKGEIHWQRIQFIRDFLKEDPKPITNIKIYGSDFAPPPYEFWGDTNEALQRFWRNIIGGCASARFHRPLWGTGLNDIAAANLRSMRMITDSMDFFNHLPANHLLNERVENEAYCMAFAGKEYMVYFPSLGSVFLDAVPGNYELLWLRIQVSEWQKPYSLELPGIIASPDDDHWAVLIRRK
ncbi:MAG: hypothetical protein ACLFQA_11575 [Bacteroidales bacterium]